MEQRRTKDHHTMLDDRLPQDQLQVADHARPTEHGEGDHAQSAGHGGVGRGRLPELNATACLQLIPGCETPGFDWASPNAVKVWHALYDHARRLGLAEKPRETDIGTDHPEPYLYCIWAVDLLARLLAVSRNTVGSALGGLVDLGWIRKSALRNKGGIFSGFEYAILPPPKEPTKAARHRYAEKVDEKYQEANEAVERLRKMLPDYRSTHDPDEPLPDPFGA